MPIWMTLLLIVPWCTCSLYLEYKYSWLAPDFHIGDMKPNIFLVAAAHCLYLSQLFKFLFSITYAVAHACQLFRFWLIFSVGIVTLVIFKSLCLIYFSLFFLSAREGKKQVRWELWWNGPSTEWMILETWDYSKCGRSWREGDRSTERTRST